MRPVLGSITKRWHHIHTYTRNLVNAALSIRVTLNTSLVLSVTRILRAALTKFHVCVCVYVCVCNYSSQTTEPICFDTDDLLSVYKSLHQ